MLLFLLCRHTHKQTNRQADQKRWRGDRLTGVVVRARLPGQPCLRFVVRLKEAGFPLNLERNEVTQRNFSFCVRSARRGENGCKALTSQSTKKKKSSDFFMAISSAME
jgi:hypothetical protein